jgi:hypothetical protein
MSQSIAPISSEGREAARELFQQGGPVLVEVRFPATATSPDWYLCEDESDFDSILDRIRPGAELYVSRVWDLTNQKGAVRIVR